MDTYICPGIWLTKEAQHPSMTKWERRVEEGTTRQLHPPLDKNINSTFAKSTVRKPYS